MVPHTYDGGQDARDQDMPAPTQALATQALSVQSLIDGTPLTEHDYTDQPLPSALPPIGDSMPRPATSPAWEQCGEADYLPASSAYQPSATGSAMTSGSPTVKRSVHYKYNMTAQTNGSNGYRSGYHSYMPQQLYDEEQLAQYTVSMDPAAAPGQHPNYAAVPEERRHPHLVPGSWYYDSAEDNGLVGCEEMASTQLAETQPPWPHQAFDPITHTFHLTTKRSPSVDDSAAPSPKRVRVETMTP
ncbi:hypothetical protein H4R35_001045 [Dimargaris xerosporica]|nr:hypothetical protein H4R35_001045 [Dimargaris xerosporica]